MIKSLSNIYDVRGLNFIAVNILKKICWRKFLRHLEKEFFLQPLNLHGTHNKSLEHLFTSGCHFLDEIRECQDIS